MAERKHFKGDLILLKRRVILVEQEVTLPRLIIKPGKMRMTLKKLHLTAQPVQKLLNTVMVMRMKQDPMEIPFRGQRKALHIKRRKKSKNQGKDLVAEPVHTRLLTAGSATRSRRASSVLPVVTTKTPTKKGTVGTKS